MKEFYSKLIGIILTSASGVINLTNIATWLTENKIFFNIAGASLITILTLVWWLFKIRNDNRKSAIEMDIKRIELEERKISCDERKIELEISKQSLNDINRKIQ